MDGAQQKNFETMHPSMPPAGQPQPYPPTGNPMMHQQLPSQPPPYYQGQQMPPTVITQQPVFAIQMAAPLTHTSQRLTCSACQAQIMTRVEYETASKTHLAALLLCVFVGCCGCCLIPYCKLSVVFINQKLINFCTSIRLRLVKERKPLLPTVRRIHWCSRTLSALHPYFFKVEHILRTSGKFDLFIISSVDGTFYSNTFL